MKTGQFFYNSLLFDQTLYMADKNDLQVQVDQPFNQINLLILLLLIFYSLVLLACYVGRKEK